MDWNRNNHSSFVSPLFLVKRYDTTYRLFTFSMNAILLEVKFNFDYIQNKIMNVQKYSDGKPHDWRFVCVVCATVSIWTSDDSIHKHLWILNSRCWLLTSDSELVSNHKKYEKNGEAATTRTSIEWKYIFILFCYSMYIYPVCIHVLFPVFRVDI